MNRYRFEVFSRRTLRGKRWFFRMKSANNETVAQSEAYNSKAAAIDGANTVRLHATRAAVVVQNEQGTYTGELP